VNIVDGDEIGGRQAAAMSRISLPRWGIERNPQFARNALSMLSFH
jgi:hypothetical protein